MSRGWVYGLPKGRLGDVRSGPEALDPDSLWIARDVPGRLRPTKQFRLCESWPEYEVALLESGMKHMYELVPDGLRTPVWFFADHDCRTESARGMTAEEFVREVCRVHRVHFDLAESDMGSVMFVSSTCRPEKHSVHVKINMATTLAESRVHAEAICEQCGADDRLKPDLSVYSSRAQQIRAINSSKIGHDVVKAPVAGCAGPAFRHLVRVNPNHGMREITRPLPEARPRAKAPRGDALPVDGGEVMVRAALRRSIMPRLLGAMFDAGASRLEDVRAVDGGAMLMCYLDGSLRAGGSVRCPFAGRAHRTNRARILVRPNGGERGRTPGTGEVEYRCLDVDCQENGKRIVVPYDVRQTEDRPPASRAAS
eukprot:jgi/Tetstr1/454016/TSEL_040935.t1